MVDLWLRRLAKLAPADVRKLLAPSSILRNQYISAKLFPLAGGGRSFVVERQSTGGDMPIPPRAMWEGYGETAEEYLALGRDHVDKMLQHLRERGARPEQFVRVLEFGCAAGRMLRFVPRPPDAEFWGVDIKAHTIDWCQQNLAPLRFAATTTYPHLPFEDRYFDLVYAGSVFTHIADLPDAWFLELLRVLKPGGYAYLTVIDGDSVRKFFEEYKGSLGWWIDAMTEFDRKTGFLTNPRLAMCSVEAGSWNGFPVPQVVYDLDYLQEKWGAWAKSLGVCRFSYGAQHAVIFQKTA
jgi:SAM-dependent methyltransferase